MLNNKGFSLIEVLAAVGMIGVLSTIGVYSYIQYIPKAQASESLVLVNKERTKIVNIIKNGVCANEASGEQGRYGNLVVSGQYIANQKSNCPIGCVMTVTFNDQSAKQIANTRLALGILGSGEIVKIANQTTTPEKYIPKSLKNMVSASASECAVLNNPSSDEGWGFITNPPAFLENLIGHPSTGNNNGGGGTNNPNPNNPDPSTNDPDPDTNNPNNPTNPGNGGSGGNGDDNNDSTPPSSTDSHVVTTSYAFEYFPSRDHVWKLTSIIKKPNGETCESNVDVLPGEYVAKIGGGIRSDETGNILAPDGSRFFYKESDYWIEHGFNISELNENILKRTSVDELDAHDALKIFVPCGMGIVGKASPRAAIMHDIIYALRHEPSAITIVNSGLISGRGGDAGDYLYSTENPLFDSLENYTFNHKTNFNLVDRSTPLLHPYFTRLDTRTDMTATIDYSSGFSSVAGRGHGGAAIVNLAPTAFNVFNRGVIQGGGAASNFRRILLDKNTRQAIFIGGSGGAPYGKGGTFRITPDSRRSVLTNCTADQFGWASVPNPNCEVYTHEFPMQDFDYPRNLAEWGLTNEQVRDMYGTGYSDTKQHVRSTMHNNIKIRYQKLTADNLNGRIYKGNDATFSQGGKGRCVSGVCTSDGRSSPVYDGVSDDYFNTFHALNMVVRINTRRTYNGHTNNVVEDLYYHSSERLEDILPPEFVSIHSGPERKDGTLGKGLKVNSDYALAGPVVYNQESGGVLKGRHYVDFPNTGDLSARGGFRTLWSYAIKPSDKDWNVDRIDSKP